MDLRAVARYSTQSEHSSRCSSTSCRRRRASVPSMKPARSSGAIWPFEDVSFGIFVSRPKRIRALVQMDESLMVGASSPEPPSETCRCYRGKTQSAVNDQGRNFLALASLFFLFSKKFFEGRTDLSYPLFHAAD
jgi:hypothetical protein